MSLNAIHFERKIKDRFYLWYRTYSNKILYVEGARQVGKTFLIQEFASDVFKKEHTFYLNLNDINAFRILTSIAENTKYIIKDPFKTNIAQELQNSLKGFEDEDDFVLIIDEIQLSSKVFNLLRNLSRETQAKIIVTGSYLGVTSNSEFFFPAGDLFKVEIQPLTFEEFLTAIPEWHEVYQKGISKENYTILDKELINIFKTYLYYGAYPEVLKELAQQLINKQFNKEILEEKLTSLKETWIEESSRYFSNTNAKALLPNMFEVFCIASFNEKIGSNYSGKFTQTTFQELLSNITYAKGGIRPNKEEQSLIFGWFKASHIMTTMSRYNPSENIKNLALINLARVFYKCTGHIRQVAQRSESFKTNEEMEGFLLEAYVANLLSMLISLKGINEDICFMVDDKISGELDFCTYRLSGAFPTDIGIEVKRGKNKALTGKKYLENKYIKTLITTRLNIINSEDLSTENPLIPLIYLENYLAKLSESVQQTRLYYDQITQLFN